MQRAGSALWRLLMLVCLVIGLDYLTQPVRSLSPNSQTQMPAQTRWHQLIVSLQGQTQAYRQHIALLRLPAPEPNSLPNPVPNHRFTDSWGSPRSGGRQHEGIDIFAERGTPIHSNIEAVVLKIGDNTLGGKTVTLMGAGGWRHYYAHLDSYADIQEGDWIHQGEVIGTVGNTGNAISTPPHLHYGIYTSAGAVNPYVYLVK